MGWLSGYSYRKKVTISGSSGAGENYQVKLSIGSSSGGDFHLEGHCEDFPNDIRFTDDDGVTLLDYWIEDLSQDPITVWVEVKDSLDNDVDIYVYYGNPSATDASNGDATFEFFDDFDNLEDYDYFTTRVGTGFFQMNVAPTALHHNNKTFVVWRSDSGDPYINVYDHVTGEWAGDVKVGESNIPTDEHGAPSIVRDTDGYLHVFHGAHHSALQHEKSNNPDDISAWTSQSNIGSSVTYPRVVLVNDTIYLFYRESSGSGGREIYRTSSDNGNTWSDENTIIDFGGSDLIYAGPVEVSSDDTQIHIAWCYYSDDYHNVYHAYLNLSDHHMYSMNGTDLGTTISKTDADTHCLVYEGSAYIPYVRLDSLGYPHIAWSWKTTGDLKYTKWNGSGWEDVITIASNRVGADFIINSDNDIDIYTRHDKNETYDAERWHWNGSSWSLADIIISDSDSKTKTLTVHNYHSDIAAIVGVNNDCLYAYGPNSGFIGNSLPSLDTEKWTVIQGNVSVSDSSLHLTGTTGTRGLIDGKTEIAQGAAIHARAKYLQTNTRDTHFCTMRKSGDWDYKVDIYVRYSDGRPASVTKDAGTASRTDWSSVDTPTDWHEYKITWQNSEVKYYQDDNLKVTHSNNIPSTNLVPTFCEGTISSGDIDIDWVFVRKFASPEPSFSNAQSEEGPVFTCGDTLSSLCGNWWAVHGTSSDTFLSSSSSLPRIEFGPVCSEILDVSDSFNSILSLISCSQDALGLTDSNLLVSSLILNAIDSIDVSDGCTLSFSFTSSCLDVLHAIDSASYPLPNVVNCLDSLGAQDSISSFLSMLCQSKDNIGGADGETSQLSVERVLLDILTFQDTSSYLSGIIASASDVLNTQDLNSVRLTFSCSSIDVVKNVDSGGVNVTFHLDGSDILKGADFVSGNLQILLDSLAVFKSADQSASSLLGFILRSATDVLDMYDLNTATLQISSSSIDIFRTEDNSSINITLHLNSADVFKNSDSAILSLQALLSALETLKASDSSTASVFAEILASASDLFATSDYNTVRLEFLGSAIDIVESVDNTSSNVTLHLNSADLLGGMDKVTAKLEALLSAISKFKSSDESRTYEVIYGVPVKIFKAQHKVLVFRAE